MKWEEIGVCYLRRLCLASALTAGLTMTVGVSPGAAQAVVDPDAIAGNSEIVLKLSPFNTTVAYVVQFYPLWFTYLPAVKLVWADLAAQADKEGWPAARFLAALAEHETAERGRRRIERHLAEARLPVSKTLDTFDFEAVPVVSKAQVMALAAGDSWLEKGANLIMFGPPGGGKSHLAAALGLALVENGWRVLFTRTTDMVQRLQIARRELALESAISKLDKYHLLILDDLAYVTKDQAETSVLFELIGARYERRSLLVTANQPFGEWGKVFPDQAMTLAVVDRLVHHATIFEMNVESYRRRAALERKRGPGRPPSRATIKATA